MGYPEIGTASTVLIALLYVTVNVNSRTTPLKQDCKKITCEENDYKLDFTQRVIWNNSTPFLEIEWNGEVNHIYEIKIAWKNCYFVKSLASVTKNIILLPIPDKRSKIHDVELSNLNTKQCGLVTIYIPERNPMAEKKCCEEWDLTLMYKTNLSDCSVSLYFDRNNVYCNFSSFNIKVWKPEEKNYQISMPWIPIMTNRTFKTTFSLPVGKYCFRIQPQDNTDCLVRTSSDFTITWKTKVTIESVKNGVNVSFTVPPPNLEFKQCCIYICKIYNNSSSSPVQYYPVTLPIAHHVFKDLVPGKYQGAVRPLETELDESCTNNGKPRICQDFMINYSHSEVIIPDIKSYKYWLLFLLIPIFISGLFGLMIKKDKIVLQIENKWKINNEIKPANSFYMSFSLKNVLILYTEDSVKQKKAVYDLKDDLQKSGYCQVTLVPGVDHFKEAVYNRHQWIQHLLNHVDKIILVSSSALQDICAHTNENTSEVYIDNMLMHILDYLICQAQNDKSFNSKLILVRFCPTPAISLPFLHVEYCYLLPEALTNLLHHIHDLPTSFKFDQQDIK